MLPKTSGLMAKQIFIMVLYVMATYSSTQAFRLFGFGEQKTAESQRHRFPKPQESSSWLLDLLYPRKRPQYYEPRPEDTRLEVSRFDEVYEDYSPQFEQDDVEADTGAAADPAQISYVPPPAAFKPVTSAPVAPATLHQPEPGYRVVAPSLDYLEIITAPPAGSSGPSAASSSINGGYVGQSFEVKVGARFNTKQ